MRLTVNCRKTCKKIFLATNSETPQDFIYDLGEEAFDVDCPFCGETHCYTIGDITPEGVSSMIPAGSIIGAAVGSLAGPIGVIVGCILGALGGWWEDLWEKRKINRWGFLCQFFLARSS